MRPTACMGVGTSRCDVRSMHRGRRSAPSLPHRMHLESCILNPASCLLQRLPLAFRLDSVTLAAMPKPSGPKRRRPKAIMLGVGLDSDGHKRITTGDNFALVGGSKDTHVEMTEKVLKINEKLVERG